MSNRSKIEKKSECTKKKKRRERNCPGNWEREWRGRCTRKNNPHKWQMLHVHGHRLFYLGQLHCFTASAPCTCTINKWHGMMKQLAHHHLSHRSFPTGHKGSWDRGKEGQIKGPMTTVTKVTHTCVRWKLNKERKSILNEPSKLIPRDWRLLPPSLRNGQQSMPMTGSKSTDD